MVQVVQVRGGGVLCVGRERAAFSLLQTTIIPQEEDIDPDVFAAMTSLGCFKDRPRLIEALLNSK